MPRARSPVSIEAERLWKEEHLLLKEIAAKLGVAEGTVRRWKSTQSWEKKESERSEKEKANVRKRGAPKQNNNARNRGAYAAVRWDFLDEEETKIKDSCIDGKGIDRVEDMLIEEITLYTIRERRIMRAINQKREEARENKGLYVANIRFAESKRRFKTEEERQAYEDIVAARVDKGDRLPGESYEMITDRASSTDQIARLEKELSTVQKAKTAAIAELHKYYAEKQKAESAGKGGETVKAWAEAVMRKRKERQENGNG